MIYLELIKFFMKHNGNQSTNEWMRNFSKRAPENSVADIIRDCPAYERLKYFRYHILIRWFSVCIIVMAFTSNSENKSWVYLPRAQDMKLKLRLMLCDLWHWNEKKSSKISHKT
jgi:hypothetical protein